MKSYERGRSIFYQHPPSPKDSGFSQWELQIFSSQKPTKFGTLGHFFQRCRQNVNPEFIFQRTLPKNQGYGSLPSLEGGGGGKKWNDPCECISRFTGMSDVLKVLTIAQAVGKCNLRTLKTLSIMSDHNSLNARSVKYL